MSLAASLDDEEPAERPNGPWGLWRLRADPSPLLLLALFFLCGQIWMFRTPSVAKVELFYYFDFCFGWLCLGSLAAGRYIQLLMRNETETRLRINSGVHRSRRRFAPWFLLIVAGIWILLHFEAPLQAGFLFSRPALDALADAARKDPAKAPLLAGRWAGVYRIAGVEVIGETVVLYVDREKGKYGFARVPNAKGAHVHNIPLLDDKTHHHDDFPKYEGMTDPVGDRFFGDWFVVYSSYMRHKVGWS